MKWPKRAEKGRHIQNASALPEFVEPMKAKLVASLPSGDWIYEIKFDGYRALALRGGGDTRILSRNEKDLGRKFKEVSDSVSALNVHDAMIFVDQMLRTRAAMISVKDFFKYTTDQLRLACPL